MQTGNTNIIRLCYRKIISNTNQNNWDKLVWESTYAELQMQRQLYDQQNTNPRFADLLFHHPRAENLHYLVSTSVVGYIKQLNNIIPDIQDNLGRSVLNFNQYKFEIINSNSLQKNEHSVAINFFSNPLILQQTMGNHFIVSTPLAVNDDEGFTPTFTFQWQLFLSIAYLKTV